MLAACMLAAITLSLISCDWFGKKKHYVSENNIVGKWLIDSVENKIVSDFDPVKGLLFSGPAFSGSLPVTVEFTKDSIYTMYNDSAKIIGSDKYYFDSSSQKLFAREVSSFRPFALSALSDSSIQVSFSNDSIHYIMKRQP